MADSFMAALNNFEVFSSTKINDYAKVRVNDDLIKMMDKLKGSLAADDTAHRETLAKILAKTAKTQALLLETIDKTGRTRSQTDRIAAATANLDAVRAQLTGATHDASMAELAAKVQGRGGKSRSRKSHKKVSQTKRPKKSVHSRKVKGAKRSNKKH
jgi:hypothetical protein